MAGMMSNAILAEGIGAIYGELVQIAALAVAYLLILVFAIDWWRHRK
jgi:hypothetical protein